MVDNALGPEASKAAMVWHFPEGSQMLHNRIQIRSGEHSAEAVVLPANGTIHTEKDDTGLQVLGHYSGHLSMVAVFLTGEWVGSKVMNIENRLIVNGPKQILLSIP